MRLRLGLRGKHPSNNGIVYEHIRLQKTDAAVPGGYHFEFELYNGAELLTLNGANFTQTGLSVFSGPNLVDGIRDITSIGFHTDSAGPGSELKYTPDTPIAFDLLRLWAQPLANAEWDVYVKRPNLAEVLAFTGLDVNGNVTGYVDAAISS